MNGAYERFDLYASVERSIAIVRNRPYGLLHPQEGRDLNADFPISSAVD